MEAPDVGILYCEDAAEWCDCLTRNLKMNFPDKQIFNQKLEDLLLPLTLAKRGYFLRIKAQIVIITPNLLEYMKTKPEVILGQLFDHTRVLAFVCGVDESDFHSMHRANLVSYESWTKVQVTETAVDGVKDTLQWIAGVFSEDDSAESRKQNKAGFKLHPSKVREAASKVIIEILDPVAEGQTLTLTVNTETESIPLKPELCNPYMAKFILPDRFFDVSQIVDISVNCGAKSLGSQPLKCESQMGEMNSLLRTILHPLSFMCQTLGIAESRIEELDHILTNVVKVNIPKCGFSVMDLSSHIDRQRDVELPTLLHFSAKMGLKELSAVLLDCPGGEAACRLRNVDGHTPADLAEKEGHSCLAGLLESFSSMSETAEIYIYMQRMTEEVNSKNYENLNTAFRRSLEHGFISSGLVRQMSDNDVSAEGACDVSAEGACGGQTLPSNSYENTEFQEQLTIRSHQESAKGSNMHLYGQSQQELIQLIEDFKEEKYDIEQVEVLFKSWQQKQHSRSFHEKQEQLKHLREQYEQLQNQCHDKTKKKSALERFRFMLLGNVKKEEVSTPVKAKAVYKREKSCDSEDMVPDLREKQRPISTWSCGSNGSSLSDRSSTMSGTSDSGTLSDIGEEKHLTVSAAYENRHYMYTAKPLPPLPTKKPTRVALSSSPSAATSSTPKQVSQKPANSNYVSPKIKKRQTRQQPLKSCLSTQSSISDRKPMPPPRLELPSFTVSSSPETSGEKKDNRHTTAAIPFPQNLKCRKTSLTNLGCSAPESDTSNDGYLLMNSQRLVPGRRPSEPINLAPSSAGADYYNEMPSGPAGDYMIMDASASADVPRSAVRNTLAVSPSSRHVQSPSYVNVKGVQGNTVEFDHDRCDSVPEMMAPPPPTAGTRQGAPSSSTGARQKAPPLPPRNPEKSSPEEASSKKN